jgi:DNA gyrase/topoisomerase IV subunit A
MVMKVFVKHSKLERRVVMRAKVGFEEVEGRECIIVSEIPYQVNKADMIKRTADLVNDEEELQIFDESDRMVCVSFIFKVIHQMWF